MGLFSVNWARWSLVGVEAGTARDRVGVAGMRNALVLVCVGARGGTIGKLMRRNCENGSRLMGAWLGALRVIWVIENG